MSTLGIIALVFAGWFLVAGLALIVENRWFCKILADLVKSPGQIFYWGFFALTVGLITVGVEYRLNLPNWRWVVPLFGWVSLAKGAWFILVPESIKPWVRAYCPPGLWTIIGGAVCVVLGGWLLWLALAVY